MFPLLVLLYIDEFLAKLVLDFGFLNFNQIFKIKGMNETISFLAERSLYDEDAPKLGGTHNDVGRKENRAAGDEFPAA
jgi:hypothetical protein